MAYYRLMQRIFALIFREGNEDVSNPDIRNKYAFLQGIVSIIVNLVIFAAKFTAGLILHSVSLIADGFHTLSDVLTSVIIMVGFNYARKPGDKEHPFGHQRIESISGVIVSVLLIVTGIEFIRTSINRIIDPQITSAGWIVILIVIVTILLKEMIAQFALFLGNRIDSPALRADFWHHRTDAISSVFVIIALVCSRYNIPAIDGYMGIIVSLMIIWSGIVVLRESSEDLIGKPPEKKLIDSIEGVVDVYGNEGAVGYHDIILNYYGRKIVGSLHVEIDEGMTLHKAHTLSEKIEDNILEKTGAFITVHIDPVNTSNPELAIIRKDLRDIIEGIKGIDSVHDIRAIGENEWTNVAFDLTVSRNFSSAEQESIKNDILVLLQKRHEHIHAITIKFEPLFSY